MVPPAVVTSTLAAVGPVGFFRRVRARRFNDPLLLRLAACASSKFRRGLRSRSLAALARRLARIFSLRALRGCRHHLLHLVLLQSLRPGSPRLSGVHGALRHSVSSPAEARHLRWQRRKEKTS